MFIQFIKKQFFSIVTSVNTVYECVYVWVCARVCYLTLRERETGGGVTKKPKIPPPLCYIMVTAWHLRQVHCFQVSLSQFMLSLYVRILVCVTDFSHNLEFWTLHSERFILRFNCGFMFLGEVYLPPHDHPKIYFLSSLINHFPSPGWRDTIKLEPCSLLLEDGDGGWQVNKGDAFWSFC